MYIQTHKTQQIGTYYHTNKAWKYYVIWKKSFKVPLIGDVQNRKIHSYKDETGGYQQLEMWEDESLQEFVFGIERVGSRNAPKLEDVKTFMFWIY